MRGLACTLALLLSSCSAPPNVVDHRRPSSEICVERWLALDDARREAQLELAFNLLGHYDSDAERGRRLALRFLEREREAPTLSRDAYEALEYALLRLSEPELRAAAAASLDPWRARHASRAPVAPEELERHVRELSMLSRFESAARVLAGQDFDAQRAFEALLTARLEQFEFERAHPPPRAHFCLSPEDWAAIQAHPFVNRGGVELGPRLTPAVLDFLEAVATASQRLDRARERDEHHGAGGG